MFLTRLFQYMRGYLVITITGRYPERFLNVCSNRHILIWDLFPCSQTMLRCCISNRAFRLLPPIAKKTGVRIKIVKKCGLPTVLKRGKKRKWFVLGLGVFLLMLILVNQFIWKIEIVGCENISAGVVREQLERCGLRVGAFRPFLDEKKLQNKMLIEVPELAWLWADKSGSKVTVQIKEKVPVPEMFDPHAFCNVVASKDGVIDSMIVKSGEPMVKLGDTVRRGDILVNGLWVSEKGVEPRKVQSDAEIYARVWYEKTKALSLWTPKINETGAAEKKITLHLFGWNMNLFLKGETEFLEYTETTEERELSFLGNYLGVGMTCQQFREQTTTYEKLSPERAAESGILQLTAEIDEQTSANAHVVNISSNYEVLDEDTIEVTVVAEYLEDIAQKVYLE